MRIRIRKCSIHVVHRDFITKSENPINVIILYYTMFRQIDIIKYNVFM